MRGAGAETVEGTAVRGAGAGTVEGPAVRGAGGRELRPSKVRARLKTPPTASSSIQLRIHRHRPCCIDLPLAVLVLFVRFPDSALTDI